MKLLILLALTASYHVYGDYAANLRLQDNVAMGVYQGMANVPRATATPPTVSYYNGLTLAEEEARSIKAAKAKAFAEKMQACYEACGNATVCECDNIIP